MKPICARCGEEFARGRYDLGFRTCLSCGEVAAKAVRHCIVPMNKSNYIPVTDRNILSQLNPKRTI